MERHELWYNSWKWTHYEYMMYLVGKLFEYMNSILNIFFILITK